ncbi:MAG TPA: TraR/DksA C4-type zinc finger protein [Longimicrobiales bacterium]|nr:TraR/DksA C4-type zinc finger protein [Longimicrobiales bacterium]
MNKRQRAKIEKRLVHERTRVLRALARFDDRFANLEEDGDLTNYPLHMADEGTDTMEQEKEFLLASQEGTRLYRIDEALRTLYKEPKRFGRCELCGNEIRFERLEILPWTTVCAGCQRTREGVPVGAGASGGDEDEAA